MPCRFGILRLRQLQSIHLIQLMRVKPEKPSAISRTSPEDGAYLLGTVDTLRGQDVSTFDLSSILKRSLSATLAKRSTHKFNADESSLEFCRCSVTNSLLLLRL